MINTNNADIMWNWADVSKPSHTATVICLCDNDVCIGRYDHSLKRWFRLVPFNDFYCQIDTPIAVERWIPHPSIIDVVVEREKFCSQHGCAPEEWLEKHPDAQHESGEAARTEYWAKLLERR